MPEKMLGNEGGMKGMKERHPNLVANFVEERRHVAHVVDGKHRVEHLALLAVVVPCNDNGVSTGKRMITRR